MNSTIAFLSIFLCAYVSGLLAQDTFEPPSLDFVIIANGPEHSCADKSFEGVTIVALDGALAVCQEYKITPHVLLGDFDSIEEGLVNVSELGIPYRAEGGLWVVPALDQDYTDLEKAVVFCDAMGAKSIAIYNATGGRMDHSLWNLRILKRLWRENRPLYLHGLEQTLQYARDASISLSGNVGAYCGVFAFPDNAVITTLGLEWDVQDYELSFAKQESTSNRLSSTRAHIEVTGGALIVGPSF